MANITTKIVLRNDTLAAWQSANPVLLKGEIGLARLSGDLSSKYELRIGDGTSNWNSLSATNIIIPAENVSGLTETIASLSTSYYETTGDVSALTGNFVNGDIAVEKRTINGELQEFTAYRYDTTLTSDNKWRALDKNYNASNVYLDSNITMAGNYGNLGNFAHTENTVATISAEGWSVKEFFDKMFTGEEKYPAKATQSVGVSMSNATIEYGTDHAPVFTVTLSPGSYTYGSNSNTANGSTTGIKAEEYSVTYKLGQTNYTLTGDWNSQFTSTSNKSATLTGDSIENIKSKITFNSSNKLSATAAWTAAPDGTYNPLTNLKIEVKSDKLATYRVASGSTTATSGNNSYSITPHKPRFYMFTNAATTNPTAIDTYGSNVTLSNTFNKWCKSTDGKLTTSFTAPGSYFELFYAIPQNIKSSWTGVDGTGVNSLAVEAKSTITVTLANDETETYDLFIVRNAGAYSNKVCTMTFA